MRLSKSRYVAGLQCDRQLWWRVHDPDAPELVPDAKTQAVFDTGARVGRVAKTRMPGAVIIDLPAHAIPERLEATREALSNAPSAICEASFLADDTYVAVDILENSHTEWRLIEVKSTTKVKPEHIPDVAVQLHVLRESGLQVLAAELMHLNRDCTYPDLHDLFTRVDVTKQAEAKLSDVPRNIAHQLEMLDGELPSIPIGPHCDSPYVCPFKSRCWPELPLHHVSTLHRAGQRWWSLAAKGYETVDQLPEDLATQPAARRQIRAVRSGAAIVEPGLANALRTLRGPIAVIDFETVAPAIPVWPGCHPYDPVPVQFSCHVQGDQGGWTHHEWLAEGPDDPRSEMLHRLAASCANAETVLAYFDTFERHCLRLIADALPELREQAESILTRLSDPLSIIRAYVYHPNFRGSFSLKAVLPALVPDLSYEEMEIADGTAASRELERLLLHGDTVPPEERTRLRDSLRRYCQLDTWGVVRLLERLAEMGG